MKEKQVEEAHGLGYPLPEFEHMDIRDSAEKNAQNPRSTLQLDEENAYLIPQNLDFNEYIEELDYSKIPLPENYGDEFADDVENEDSNVNEDLNIYPNEEERQLFGIQFPKDSNFKEDLQEGIIQENKEQKIEEEIPMSKEEEKKCKKIYKAARNLTMKDTHFEAKLLPDLFCHGEGSYHHLFDIFFPFRQYIQQRILSIDDR